MAQRKLLHVGLEALNSRPLRNYLDDLDKYLRNRGNKVFVGGHSDIHITLFYGMALTEQQHNCVIEELEHPFVVNPSAQSAPMRLTYPVHNEGAKANKLVYILPPIMANKELYVESMALYEKFKVKYPGVQKFHFRIATFRPNTKINIGPDIPKIDFPISFGEKVFQLTRGD